MINKKTTLEDCAVAADTYLQQCSVGGGMDDSIDDLTGVLTGVGAVAYSVGCEP